MTAPAVGARVALTHDVERYPHFVAPAGAVGTVVDHGDPNLYAVRLDELLEGAEEWANEVHWILDAGDDPTADLHVVTDAAEDDFVNRDALREASAAELGQIVAAGGPTALIVAAGAELASREDDEQGRAYEIASAEVVLTLTRDEAATIAEVLGDVAGSRFLGENGDYDEVGRLAALVRRQLELEGQS